jgi:hypothetical protein
VVFFARSSDLKPTAFLDYRVQPTRRNYTLFELFLQFFTLWPSACDDLCGINSAVQEVWNLFIEKKGIAVGTIFSQETHPYKKR